MQVSKILPFLLLLSAAITFNSCKLDTKEKDTETVDLGRPADEAILHLDAEPDRLLPMLTTNNYSRTVFNGIFSYLLTSDPSTVELVPQLAKTRPEVKELTEGPYAGGMSYTFEIREEAVWDNGSPVTAEDFIFTLKAVFNPKVPAPAYRVYLSFIDDIQVDPDNPRRFTVLTSKKYIIGEEAISAALPVLPAYHYDSDGLLKDIPIKTLANAEEAEQLAEEDERLQQFADQFNSQKFSREPEGIVGSGAYRLVSWETGQRLILERKENWWGDKVENGGVGVMAYPAKLIFRPISDSNSAITTLKNGTMDVMANIQPKQFMELQETEFVADEYNFYSPPSLVNTFVYLNTRIPALQDKKVRQALAYAINANEIIETAFYGLAERTVTPVHPSFTYYNKDLETISYQPEKARALLAEAGWEDSNNNGILDKEIEGQLVELSLKYNYTAGRSLAETTALLIQESTKSAGFDIQPVPQEFTVTQEALQRRDFELVGGAKLIQSTPWEPKQDFHSDGDDRTGFASPETDALIDRIQITIDEKERNELYKELQAVIYDEMPLVYIMVPQSRIIIHKRFGTEVTPIFPGYVPQLLQLNEK